MKSKIVGSVIIVNFFFATGAAAMVTSTEAPTQPELQAESEMVDTSKLSRAEKRALRKAKRQAKREARRAKRAELANQRRGRPRYSSFDRFDPFYPYGFRSAYHGGFSRFGFRGSRFSRYRFRGYRGLGFGRRFVW